MDIQLLTYVLKAHCVPLSDQEFSEHHIIIWPIVTSNDIFFYCYLSHMFNLYPFCEIFHRYNDELHLSYVYGERPRKSM